MFVRPILACGLSAVVLLTGCRGGGPTAPAATSLGPQSAAAAANRAFLGQPKYDPWVLSSRASQIALPAYVSDGQEARLVTIANRMEQAKIFRAGQYSNGQLTPLADDGVYARGLDADDELGVDMHAGQFYLKRKQAGTRQVFPSPRRRDWNQLWQSSDVVIKGDPQAQQVTHANLFYLLSSTFPGSKYSIPPLGLSSSGYGGHIFWDADVWMLPALIVQHPEYAKPIVDYRFKLLAQAEKNASAHGYKGAEYPWESADTGREEAPAEFARERHVTADVAFAVWQYYLWTGDKSYLRSEGWPLLQATARYWVSRVTKGADGKYHIEGVVSPDETAGVVDDDAYTNSVVRYSLLAAQAAADAVTRSADPRWRRIADGLFLAVDQGRGIIAENSKPLTDRFSAKQADTLLLLHPIGFHTDPQTEGKMLDFYTAHTIKTGPAMTSSIGAIVAARLGRAQQSLDLFHDSYQPFMRAPWDAFSEKRTTNNVYFLTGMAGCLQSVLYGFAGLQAVPPWGRGAGRKLVEDGDAALYCDPHLPPGWEGLTVKGIRFHGKTLDLSITPGNRVSVRAVAVKP